MTTYLGNLYIKDVWRMKDKVKFLQIQIKKSTFTHGCFYRNVGNSIMMSMFGSVTDAKAFDSELTNQEMEDIVGCK